MKRPFIYFAGDESRCQSVIKSLSSLIQASFIVGRHTKLPKDKYPALICIISKPNANGNSVFLSRILRYSAAYRCPIFFIGSKHQYLTLLSKFPKTPIYKINLLNLYIAIRQISYFSDKFGDDELSILKTRYRTVILETREAALAAYINGKVNTCPRRDLRMVLTDDFSKINSDNRFVAHILSENKDGVIFPDKLRKMKSTSPLLIAAGFEKPSRLKSKIKYINLSDDNDEIIKTIIRQSDEKFTALNITNLINNKDKRTLQSK